MNLTTDHAGHSQGDEYLDRSQKGTDLGHGITGLLRVLLSREAADGLRLHVHLSWSSIAVDSQVEPSMLQIHLKQSKNNQFGRGINVFIRRIENELCPVAAALAYLAVCGGSLGRVH